MPRYVLSHRLAGLKSGRSRSASARAFDHVLAAGLPAGIHLVALHKAQSAGGRRVAVLDGDARAVAKWSRKLPDGLILEREIIHLRPLPHAIDHRSPPNARPLPPGKRATLRVSVMTVEGPSRHSNVMLQAGRGRNVLQQQVRTDHHGTAHFTFRSRPRDMVLAVVPDGTYWPMRVDRPPPKATALCPTLPKAIKRLGWWHESVGIHAFKERRGRGIRVGVLDTGLAKHPDLAHVKNVGAFVGGRFFPKGGHEVAMHGTYTCGLLAARPPREHAFAGLSPGALVHSARIFTTENDASQADLANAIHYFVHTHKVDLLNLSLGASTPSAILHDEILDAFQHGTLCVVAAGNTGGPVAYPAAFPECVAVSAIGRKGWGPPGSLSASRLPTAADRLGHGEFYLANMSAFGDGIDCAAPGVGVISTVPPHRGLRAPYLPMDGTSASAAIVTGVLAAMLADAPPFRSLPRSRARTIFARRLLRNSCRSAELGIAYQGAGIPTLPTPPTRRSSARRARR